MTNARAKEILQYLADGIDPITGELLESDHLYNSPDVIRALYTAIHALSASDISEAVRHAPKEGKLNAGRPWTDEDLEALELMYRKGEPMNRICEKLRRREKGVQKQLAYLGLTESPTKPQRNPSPGLERAGLPWTRAEDILLKDLYIEKWTIPEISLEMQRSEYSIFCRMEKLDLYGEEYGYPSLDGLPKWSNSDNAELREKFSKGMSVRELASFFGRTENCIQARLFYMGLIRELPLPALRPKGDR